METNTNNSEKLPEISPGEFNQLISQISGSTEFNKMISNLTTNLQDSFSNNIEPSIINNLHNEKDTDRILEEALEEIDNEIENKDEPKKIASPENLENENNDLVDMLGLFFADQYGNNICETLNKINKNFEKDLVIKEKLYKILCQKWNIDNDSDNDSVPELEKNFDEY